MIKKIIKVILIVIQPLLFSLYFGINKIIKGKTRGVFYIALFFSLFTLIFIPSDDGMYYYDMYNVITKTGDSELKIKFFKEQRLVYFIMKNFYSLFRANYSIYNAFMMFIVSYLYFYIYLKIILKIKKYYFEIFILFLLNFNFWIIANNFRYNLGVILMVLGLYYIIIEKNRKGWLLAIIACVAHTSLIVALLMLILGSRTKIKKLKIQIILILSCAINIVVYFIIKNIYYILPLIIQHRVGSYIYNNNIFNTLSIKTYVMHGSIIISYLILLYTFYNYCFLKNNYLKNNLKLMRIMSIFMILINAFSFFLIFVLRYINFIFFFFFFFICELNKENKIKQIKNIIKIMYLSFILILISNISIIFYLYSYNKTLPLTSKTITKIFYPLPSLLSNSYSSKDVLRKNIGLIRGGRYINKQEEEEVIERLDNGYRK